MARTIQPVKTVRVPETSYGEPPPSIEERLEALTDAVETALTTPAEAPERQSMLERLAELRDRGRGSRSSREGQ